MSLRNSRDMRRLLCVWTQPFPPAVASNQRCRANFLVESDRSAIRQGPDTEDNAARRATAQTGSSKLHSLFLCFRPSHAGRSLVSDDAQRLCELCSISKNISPLCWPVAHPCSSRAERTGRHSRPLHFQCSNQTASPMLMLLLSLLTLPYLASHRSSTTLIFPPPRRASIAPLSDDNQHEAPISTPTLRVGHLHPHQRCSIHGCRPVLISPLMCDHFVCDQGPTRSKVLVPACLFTMRSKHSPFLFSEPANHRTPSMASAGKFPL